MSYKWRTATLGEIACNISRPFDFKNIESVVFVNTGDVLSGEFLHENKIDAKGLPGQAKKAIEKGDILYSEIRPGNKRYVLVSKDNVENFVVSTKFMVIKTTGPVSPEYLYLVLTSRECEEEFKVIADSRSGTFPQVTFDSVSYYPVRFPSAKLQKVVVAIDGAITKKIQLNQQVNQTLEQIAQALFKSWFVDFDPVKAKIDVLEAGGSEEEALLAAMQVISSKNAEELAAFEVEKPEEYAELRATAALFPAVMVESELGEIPEGWEASILGDHFNVVMGQSPKGDTYNENGQGILFFQGRRDFGFRYPEPRVYTTDPKRLAQAGDTLISVRAPVGDRNMAAQECCLGRGVAGLRHKSGARGFTYAFIGHIEKRLGDSGSEGTVFSSINKKELEHVDFIAPSKELVKLFECYVDPIDQKIELLTKEIKSLETLQDSLLPKLLSGELDVSELADSLGAET